MTQYPPAPTSSTDRLIHLDVARGFALLGILLVNFRFFSDPVLELLHTPAPTPPGLDGLVAHLLEALVAGKFYPLFSMLFGAGFILIIDKVSAGLIPNAIYLRRLVVLAGLGTIHALLIWSGDILLLYAILGLLMWLMFARTQTKTLLVFAAVFILIPLSFHVLVTLGFELMRLSPELYAEVQASMEEQSATMQAMIDSARQIYATGDYGAATNQRMADTAYFYGWDMLLYLPPTVLGFFLIGAALMRSERLRNPEQHAQFFRRLSGYGLGLGIPLGVLASWQLEGLDYYQPTLHTLAASFTHMASAILLSLGYLAISALYAQRLTFLAPVGRMALTLYLMQSLFWTWIFYGYGLGLEKPAPTMQLVLALVFFVVQVLLAHWWLARFHFGPVEWLWRSLTYLRLAPMKKEPQQKESAYEN